MNLQAKEEVVSSGLAPPDRRRGGVLAALGGALLAGCHARQIDPAPTIEFTRIPKSDPGGRENNDIIEGVVKRGRPGQKIVLYTRSDKWWIQPLVSNPFTEVKKDSQGTNATHLGTEYAALLVEPGYHLTSVIDVLPTPGGDVAAVAAIPGNSQGAWNSSEATAAMLIVRAMADLVVHRGDDYRGHRPDGFNVSPALTEIDLSSESRI